jgi:hypothetical protein
MAKPLQYQIIARALELNQIIARALELISDEANWSRGAWARTSTGKPCAWIHPHAAKYCAVGALNRAAFELATEGWFDLAVSAEKHVKAASSIPGQHLPFVNDAKGHAVIVAVFKRALA